MAYLPGTTIPQEWFYWLAVIPIIIIGYAVYHSRKGGTSQDDEAVPTTQRLLLLLKVDQNKTLQVGKLIEGVTLEGNDLTFADPDVLDPLANPEPIPKIQRTPWIDVVPAQVIDAVGKLVEVWGGILHKGEYKLFSFADIAQNVRGRFDPLPADPTAVGAHYVPMSRGQSGITQLLQSTTGKVLLFGMIAFCFWLFGLVTGHVTHF